MQMALSNDFRKRARNAANPYGDGRTSDRVMEIIRNVLVRDGIEIKKKFYDINAEELYI